MICEATGGYEAALLGAMARAGRPAHRADARKVKAFSDLAAAHTAWSNRRVAPTADSARRFLDRAIACLERQIRAIEAEIAALLAACQPLRQVVQRLGRGPGIGTTPHPNDSGGIHGYRYTRGGRQEVKRLLFMAALSAARHHPDVRRFHQRPLANGKKPIVAMVAVMPTLIIICNAHLRVAARSTPSVAASPLP